MIRDEENTAVKILKNLNIDLYELRKQIEMSVKDKSGKNIANINSLPLTTQAEKVIRITVLEAKSLKSALVESEHLMLSILKNKENIATQILNQYDVDYDTFKSELGFVSSNPPKAEFNEDDDFDDEEDITSIDENEVINGENRIKVLPLEDIYTFLLQSVQQFIPTWYGRNIIIYKDQGFNKQGGYSMKGLQDIVFSYVPYVRDTVPELQGYDYPEKLELKYKYFWA